MPRNDASLSPSSSLLLPLPHPQTRECENKHLRALLSIVWLCCCRILVRIGYFTPSTWYPTPLHALFLLHASHMKQGGSASYVDNVSRRRCLVINPVFLASSLWFGSRSAANSVTESSCELIFFSFPACDVTFTTEPWPVCSDGCCHFRFSVCSLCLPKTLFYLAS